MYQDSTLSCNLNSRINKLADVKVNLESAEVTEVQPQLVPFLFF